MDERPTVAIVVVAFQNADVIGGLLDSIPAAVRGLDAHVVVVDNGSTDGTAEQVSLHSDVHLVPSTNRGFAAGINLGVVSSPESDAIIVLNADTRLTSSSIAPLLEAVRRPGVGISAPLIRTGEGDLILSLRREPNLVGALGLSRLGLSRYSEYLTSPEDYFSERVVDWATGAALCMSRDCYDALGGWDESYFLYSEETDLSLRARDLGFATLFVPDAEVIHLEGQSGRSARTYSMQEVNRVRLYRRRHGRVKGTVFLTALALRHLTRFVAGDAYGWPVMKALVSPRSRPRELNCSDRWLPS
jgi:N-acetylglucosaminyl-diphospho-decaprenol L-rhamnosyltransferase